MLISPPSRTWSIVSDDPKALPKVPCHYPPFDPNCTALVTDAPASIVLVRISECLRRRSIAVEYDDESVTARCMTVDRVHFQIQLYRPPQRDYNMGDEDSRDEPMPPHDAILVEVRKLSAGSSGMSFHMACSKILQAAKGLDTGDDDRLAHRRNGMEFQPRSMAKRKHPFSVVTSSRSFKRRRLPTLDDKSGSSRNCDKSAIAEQSLEGALELLQKDRLECQKLGMERLVNLTNKDSVGKEISSYVSRRLLQDQPNEGAKFSSPGKWKLMDSLVHPGAEQALERFEDDAPHAPDHQDSKNERMVRSFLESSALTAVTPLSKHGRNKSHHHSSFAASLARGASFLKKRSLRKNSADASDLLHSNTGTIMSPEELRHEAKLRSLALRVFCNALENLSKTQELSEILHPHTTGSLHQQPSRWVNPAFLLSLVQDLQGAGRPPSVSETGYKLASVHEAALAARCLRLLAGYESDDPDDEDHDEKDDKAKGGHASSVQQEDVRDFLRSEAVLERLEYARSCGRVTHAMLQYEAELTYNKLTEDDRSC